MPTPKRCSSCKRPSVKLCKGRCSSCAANGGVPQSGPQQAQWDRDGDGDTSALSGPTPHVPGSEARILAMVARACAGLPLFRPGDRRTA